MKRIFSFWLLLFSLFQLYFLSAVSARAESVSDAEVREILTLIKACADVVEYDSKDYDENELMRRVLYTYENFLLLTDLPPETGGSGSNKILNAAFVDDAVYKAFRITPEHPPVSMLTELRYCYNSGYYYYTGGYSGYFATAVKGIDSITQTDDHTFYVRFTDTFTDANTPTFTETSTAVVAKDANGYYIKSLHMGETPEPSETTAPETAGKRLTPSSIKPYLPLIISMLALAAIGIILYTYIL